ncbi:hypothetical protein BDA96_09G241100 [Sorghum bicolor]|uniref:Secreted protein n=2 Tax=Sorghum bicolor TaxID=4558 RepID=A0A921QCD1_SORBI|nr:hypothetical protein BDA96_09G241100 [Sorghum bicolor]OQU78409.1 hypothetical protein SORBI_3009G228201 [Sorghum bicolor]
MRSPLVVAFAVAVVVTAAAAPVADEAPTKVRLNKINLLLRCSVSPSSFTSPSSRHPSYLCSVSPFSSSTSPSSRHPQICASPTRIHRVPPPPSLLCSHRSRRSRQLFLWRCRTDFVFTGIQTWSSFFFPQRRQQPYSSVAWRMLHHRLRRPTLNRRLARPSTWVYAPSAPLRPPSGESVVVNAFVVAVVLIRSLDPDII